MSRIGSTSARSFSRAWMHHPLAPTAGPSRACLRDARSPAARSGPRLRCSPAEPLRQRAMARIHQRDAADPFRCRPINLERYASAHRVPGNREARGCVGQNAPGHGGQGVLCAVIGDSDVCDVRQRVALVRARRWRRKEDRGSERADDEAWTSRDVHGLGSGRQRWGVCGNRSVRGLTGSARLKKPSIAGRLKRAFRRARQAEATRSQLSGNPT